MGKTIVEKILSHAAGRQSSAGDIVNAKVTHLMTNDAVAELAIQAFEAYMTPRFNRNFGI